MLLVKEFDEDPALLKTPKDAHDGSDENHERHSSYSQLLAVNTSIPRREFHLDITSSSSSRKAAMVRPITTNSTNNDNNQSTRFALDIRRLKQILVDLFLPLGFPHSVDASYLSYQFYDSLQGLCSYLRGVVSTSAVLTAAGVGNADANAMGAAMTWAMKDGLGMVGGLIFSYHASPYFDAHVLEFRLFADLINDVALTLDMMAPLVPSSWLLWIMSLSTLSKTMCGMSAGATKSSITVHLALEDNMADLNAKEGTQETLVSLIGMMMGVQLARWLEQLQQIYQHQPLSMNATIHLDWKIPVEFAVSWIIFLFLTWLHIWANYRGVKLLKLKTFNRERAWGACDEFVSSLANHVCQQSMPKTITTMDFETIRSPDQVDESMLRATYTMLFPRRQLVALGVSLLDSLQASDNPTTLLQEFQHEKYIIAVDSKRRQVLATLRTGASSRDELQAFVHCILLHKCLNQNKNHSPSSSAGISDSMELIKRTHSQVKVLLDANNKNYDDNIMMKKLSEKGWNVDARLYLGFGRQRTSWESKSD